MLSKLVQTKREIDSLSCDVRTAHLDGQPSEEYLGPLGYKEYFSNMAANHICGYFWPAKGSPRGAVLLTHGMGAYLCFEYLQAQGIGKHKKYGDSWVHILNQAGYSVCGIDSRGFGRSAGMFCYVDSYTQWVADLLQFSQLVKDPNRQGFGSAPLFLLGCSLGGNLNLHAAIQQPDLFAGVVVLAPMISVEKVKKQPMNRFLMMVAGILNLLIPTWPIVGTSSNTMFPLLQQDWEANACTYSYPLRVRMAVQCLAACEDLCAKMQQLQLPLLAVHSLKDTMTDPEGSKQLCECAQSQDKTLKLVDNMWHVLVKEDGNRELLQEIIQWMETRVEDAAKAG